MGIWRALTRSVAYTYPECPDRRLRGRTYALPFAAVWSAVRDEAAAMRGWTLVSEAPARGELHAEARTRVWKFVDDVEVRVTLDAHGWTRVDLRSASRVGGADLGTNARRIARFLHRLDGRLRRAGGGTDPQIR